MHFGFHDPEIDRNGSVGGGGDGGRLELRPETTAAFFGVTACGKGKHDGVSNIDVE